MEMLNLEEQADNAKARELYWKPMGWLGCSVLGKPVERARRGTSITLALSAARSCSVLRSAGGAIRPTTANDAFDPALWETFVSTRR